MTAAQLQFPPAQSLSPSRLRRAHHRKAYGDSHAEPAGKQNSKPNKPASVSSAASAACLQGFDPRYQRRVTGFSLCLLAVELAMQSGRVVATLAFGGEEKLAINIPATGVYCRSFFM